MKPKESSWPQYVRDGFGWKLSKLGEKFGIGWMTYNPVVMENFHSGGLMNATKVADVVSATFPSARILVDVGCGSGAMAAEFARRGFQIIGCERSPHGLKLARQQGVQCVEFDLCDHPPATLTGPFDLVYSFEVAEHLPPVLGEALVHFLCELGDLIVFSAATPGQGGVGHINERPVDYWVQRFGSLSFELNLEKTEEVRRRFAASGASQWFGRNTCVFNRSAAVLS